MCDSDDGGDVYSNRNISLSDKPIKQSRVMKTKKINVEFEQAKVVNMDVDLQNLENYMSKFLALKNHQRHTDEILDVSGFDGSNKVRVVILIDDEEDENLEVQRCKDYIEQFGAIIFCEVTTAWILNDTYFDGVSSKFNEEWYVYGKQ